MEIVWKRENHQLPFVLEGFATARAETGVFFFGGADNDMVESNALYQYDVKNKSFVKYRNRDDKSSANKRD